MAALMKQYPLLLFLRQIKGQIDFGIQNTKHKGRGDRITQINTFPDGYRFPQLPLQSQPAYKRITQQHDDTQYPQVSRQKQIDLQRVDTAKGIGCGSLR